MIIDIINDAQYDNLSASEALYGFVAWLTCRKRPVTFSHVHNAGVAADLVDEFCKANNLREPNDKWVDNLMHPPEGDWGNTESADNLMGFLTGFKGETQ